MYHTSPSIANFFEKWKITCGNLGGGGGGEAGVPPKPQLPREIYEAGFSQNKVGPLPRVISGAGLG